MNARSGAHIPFSSVANNENRNFASLSFKERAPTLTTYDTVRPRGAHIRTFGRDLSNMQDVKVRPDSSNPNKFAAKRKYQLSRCSIPEKTRVPAISLRKPASTSPASRDPQKEQ